MTAAGPAWRRLRAGSWLFGGWGGGGVSGVVTIRKGKLSAYRGPVPTIRGRPRRGGGGEREQPVGWLTRIPRPRCPSDRGGGGPGARGSDGAIRVMEGLEGTGHPTSGPPAAAPGPTAGGRRLQQPPPPPSPGLKVHPHLPSRCRCRRRPLSPAAAAALTDESLRAACPPACPTRTRRRAARPWRREEATRACRRPAEGGGPRAGCRWSRRRAGSLTRIPGSACRARRG